MENNEGFVYTKKNRAPKQKPEDFIGETFNDGKLKVIGIAGKQNKITMFKVTCEVCLQDPELFPLGYFISEKGSLVKGRLPCGCAENPQWEEYQYLIRVHRESNNRSIKVHGINGSFIGNKTRLDCECLIDGHKWTPTIDQFLSAKQGCPKCGGSLKLTEQEALDKCKVICHEMGYESIGFSDGFKNNKSFFYYNCPKHGEKRVKFNSFVTAGHRCGECNKDRQRERISFYGYYPERVKEQDYLYVLDFDGKYVKVGRSFDVNQRIGELKRPQESGISNIIKLRVYTATHQEIWDLEQELHDELRGRGFHYDVKWTSECFDNDCLFILNKLLDIYKYERVL